MRIAITAGHNSYIGGNFDVGAVGKTTTEAKFVKETVSILIPMLQKQGHIVKDCTPYNEHFNTRRDSHVARCKQVDNFDADIYLDIHLNAGGGTGVETWINNANSRSKVYAEKITKNVSEELKLRNRGVKINPRFWSLSLTKKPAVIIEGAFVDNSEDMKKINPKSYATNIAKAFGEVGNVNMKNEKIKVNFLGQNKNLEGFIKDGVSYVKVETVYIPLRKLFESMGFSVDWKDGVIIIK